MQGLNIIHGSRFFNPKGHLVLVAEMSDGLAIYHPKIIKKSKDIIIGKCKCSQYKSEYRCPHLELLMESINLLEVVEE